MEKKYFNVGKLVNTQGIRGEVRVISQTDFPEERYKKGSKLTLFQEGNAPVELTVLTHRKHKNFDILTFENHTNINHVEKYKGGILKVSEEAMGSLSQDEFYYHEIINLMVVDQFGTEIGKIKEILSPGANDVWVVGRYKKKDALIPYIEDVVKSVDLENGVVHIEVMEGLIDEN
ncbi:MAG: ribosome maturation factor RimM [Streptococcaceae bacterium]|jgi:16S rRNA processing protein RimM|nr:ribosome maturation factor RimM [Streptococcaceae bacterium]